MQLVCSVCRKVHTTSKGDQCPVCGSRSPKTYDFSNSDDYLKKEAVAVKEWRKTVGLEGLVGGLEYVVINTEETRQQEAVMELLNNTGLKVTRVFETTATRTCVLEGEKPPDILVTARRAKTNPFRPFNIHPKSKHLPNTRLETFVFRTTDIKKYVSAQSAAGVRFLTDEIVNSGSSSFIQTRPSGYTGNSIGVVEWKKGKRTYTPEDAEVLDWEFKTTSKDYLRSVGQLDHTATRVKAADRDPAIIEFLSLTNYNFNFAIYVEIFNSITNVARLSDRDFAMVFTSGISPFISEETSGPTERFIHNYGTRVHHMAFKTKNVENTFNALKEDGVRFLIDLVGSREEGLKQTFSTPSAQTLLVNEYIHRYGDFDGFFTRSNVTLLTGATEKQ